VTAAELVRALKDRWIGESRESTMAPSALR